jgi:hypothetical protein
LRLAIAAMFAAVLRIVGYGAQSMAARNPSLVFLLYLIPIAGGALALLDLQGTLLPNLLERLRGSTPAAAT